LIKLNKQVESLERALDRVNAKLDTETDDESLDVLNDESYDLQMAIESLSIYTDNR